MPNPHPTGSQAAQPTDNSMQLTHLDQHEHLAVGVADTRDELGEHNQELVRGQLVQQLCHNCIELLQCLAEARSVRRL